ncbi:MAG: hypothetical protein COA78_23465 [Blastopirellula sp.]|nr:MAG: hypothetical protein COA78_23465 [Blastopirellula sp.]
MGHSGFNHWQASGTNQFLPGGKVVVSSVENVQIANLSMDGFLSNGQIWDMFQLPVFQLAISHLRLPLTTTQKMLLRPANRRQVA